MRIIGSTAQRQVTPAAQLPDDHPLVVIKNIFSVLEEVERDRPEAVAEIEDAFARLNDLVWTVRSRTLDGIDPTAQRRALERVTIATSIVSTRRADTSPAGVRRLSQAISLLATTAGESTATLTHAATTRREQRAIAPARPPQEVAEERIDAAAGPLDRAA